MSADKDARIAELERKLAEQQAWVKSAKNKVSGMASAMRDYFYGFKSELPAGYLQESTSGFFIANDADKINAEELNNLLVKAKEEGRKEILSKVTENSILIRNDKGDVGLIYLSDFRLAVQTDVMREVRNGLLGLHNEVFELLDNISERQLSKAKKSATPKSQG